MRLFGFISLFLVGVFLRYQVVGPLDEDGFVHPAFSQRQKGVPVTLARGHILDRHGIALHCPAWETALVALPGDGLDLISRREAVASVLGIDPAHVPELPLPGDSPKKLARCLEAHEIARFLDLGATCGLTVVPEELRYGRSSLACHVVGHIRTNAYLDPRDNIGESGLERAFQARLAGGEPAWAGIVATGDGGGVPGTGVRIAPPEDVPADLCTTLDAYIQRQVEDVLDGLGVRKGAAVVLDASRAEVLAMASRPVYDQAEPEAYVGREDAPFVNRAVSAFTPGSVMKPVILSFALEQGYVDVAETLVCGGEIEIGGMNIACGSSKEGHGILTPGQALAISCNSALIQIGLRLRPTDLIEYLKECGFGSSTLVHLDEDSGVLPDPYRMYTGDIANLSIGQGYLTVTPLQVAAFFRAIAAGGEYRRPTLILGEERPGPTQLFSPRTARIIEDALFLAAREGTGKEAWVSGYGSAGKTGTAETGHPSLTHAWFAGFTPVLAPKYVIVVFVEEGGSGPAVAAPIFREIASRILDTH